VQKQLQKMLAKVRITLHDFAENEIVSQRK